MKYLILKHRVTRIYTINVSHMIDTIIRMFSDTPEAVLMLNESSNSENYNLTSHVFPL